jgi:glycosyltransferase involved in cell wall biosynthesis
MKSPLISIIIPAYNSSRFIEETVFSVLAQTYKEFELLIVDDGSTDSQSEIVQKIAQQDSRVNCFYQQNKGVSAARNFGFSKSSGEYIAFLDSDDVWLPDNLKLKLDKFRLGNYGLVHSDAIIIDENSDMTEEKLQGGEGMILQDMLAWEGTRIPGPSSVLVKRMVIDEIGLFDENLSTSADQDFFFRIAARFEVGRVPEVTWKYRVHSGNMHSNISLMEKDVLYVYQKAYSNNLFKSEGFARKCFAKMYLILAASWAGDGKNFKRAFYFLSRAVLKRPGIIIHVSKRVIKKCFH